MKLSCIHCAYEFTITADQLGGRGNCPRCGGEIQLPNVSSDGQAEDPYEARPFAWIENSVSALGSLVFHMALFLILALIVQQHGGAGIAGEGQLVSIGDLPSESLSPNSEEQLSADEVKSDENSTLEELEVTSPDDVSDSLVGISPALPATSGGGNFDGALASRTGGGPMGSFDNFITQLNRSGLDIVIVFDSTGSMGGEIKEVKSQIKRIGGALTTLIPKTRIGVCTYRDTGDEFLVKGHPLTNDIQSIATFLSDIGARGGGDMPEAVQEGLKWTIDNNDFKNSARKVILVFGDAPPHPEHLKQCLELSSDFSSQQGGIVSTVTCRARSGSPLPEFIDIAQAGGGEAFLTSDERQIMSQLVVLVFGSRHRSKVLEAFELLER